MIVNLSAVGLFAAAALARGDDEPPPIWAVCAELAGAGARAGRVVPRAPARHQVASRSAASTVSDQPVRDSQTVLALASAASMITILFEVS
jgi:hypothetical protein